MSKKPIIKETNGENQFIELNDGAIQGLSDGAKMDFISSIIELVDNAEDYEAELVDIEINEEEKYIAVYSFEKNECDDYRLVFNLGSSEKVKTKKGGVGKFKQGFSYAVSNLVGSGSLGTASVISRPMNGKNWGMKQIMDYRDDSNYHDKKLVPIETSALPSKYNFGVIIENPNFSGISNKTVNLLKIKLGCRYREKIHNNLTKIIVDGQEIIEQDRLYSHFGERVLYRTAKFDYNNIKDAYVVETVDLRYPEYNQSYEEINQLELIAYDTTCGIKGRAEGVKVTERSGIEICINGVCVIQEGFLKVARNVLGVQTQPSSSGWRVRLNIKNEEVADKFLKGGNKSNMSISSDFHEDAYNQDLVRWLRDDYNNMMERFHIHDNNLHSIDIVKKWCEECSLDVDFRFGNRGKNTDTFIRSTDKGENTIFVNLDRDLFKGIGGKDRPFGLAFIGLINECSCMNADELHAYLTKFEAKLLYMEYIKNN